MSSEGTEHLELVSAYDGDEHLFGPYAVRRSVESYSRGWPLTPRRLPPSGRSEFSVTTPECESATCVLEASLWPLPVDVRLGLDANVDGRPYRITTAWLRPVRIKGADVDWALRRRGPIGWRLRTETGQLLAARRWGRLLVAPDMAAVYAALVICVVESGVPDRKGPFHWLGNI